MTGTKKVVLFLIDGLRPDGLKQADTPIIDGLMASGAHTLAGRTVMPSVTLPCHASLFMSVAPERHGITSNTWAPQGRPVPGLIDVIHKAGGKTASFYNWEELRDMSRPGSLDVSFFLNNCHERTGDLKLADLAANWLGRNEADFTFVYLGYTDTAGHDYGWMSGPYLQAIADADRCVGRVLEVLDEDCIAMITSDHGGHGRSHGTDCDEDMVIPFIVSGDPGIPAGHVIERQVNITDVAPTITSLLGLDPPTEWRGAALRFE
jgi:predicted AlkP superfamily pyrophosphatase or phosphodiesterase